MKQLKNIIQDGKIRRLLVETAEYMEGKQITPFKKTTVELED